MKLSQVLSGIEFSSKNFRDVEIKGVSIHSHQIQKNYLFIALKGTLRDGHDYIYQAIERGANVIVMEERNLEEVLFTDRVVIIRTPDTHQALPKIASNFYNNPGSYLDLVGITGTNGKTTITFLLEKILGFSGISSGIIGTICYKLANREIPALNTTPDALSIQKYMREMVDLGQDLLLIEASSHGLQQGRLDGLAFDYAIFTNLGMEHLDYHSNMEEYYQAKKILFSKLLKENGIAIINLDDNYGRRLWDEIDKRKVGFGWGPQADVRVLEFKMSLRASYLKVKAFGEEFEVYTPIIGRHNVYNILASIAMALKFGIEKEKILLALENMKNVRGRMERIYGASQLKVFIDYAHTPEALEQALLTLREVKKGKLWVIFGCGGNRYKEKRPRMGKIASRIADELIVTSDNPRDENPGEIIKDIIKGVESPDKCRVIPDRRTAIEKAIASAEANDVILIAGKGHERCQIIGNLVIPFDDKEVASRALMKRIMEEMANVF